RSLRIGDARLRGHVGEVTLAIVAVKKVRRRTIPSIPGDVQIRVPVVVIVEQQDAPGTRGRDHRFPGDVGEHAAVVAVDGHTAVDAPSHEIEVAVPVEVRPAAGAPPVTAVDARFLAYL